MNGLTRGMNKDITINEWLRGLSVGINTWNDKYKLDDNETVYEFIKRVSAGDEELMDLIYHQDFLFAGRILASRGLDKLGRKVTLSNCYVITPPEDNIESIFDRSTKMAKTFSMGGGCGIDISKLRPNGAKVNNAAKTTTGAVSFMELFNMATDIIGQKGRRGAAMISLDCTHPDVEEFIEIKSDLSKIEKANISLRMNKLFMDHVISGEDLEVSFNVEATGEIFKKVINPKKLFNRLAEINWDYAEPGILFWDRIESWNMLSEYPDFEYAGTNPCVTGDTPILTDKGHVRIDSLVGKKVNVWNGYEFSEVEPRVTGVNQKILNVKLSNGRTLKCTPYHKFILANDTRVEAKDLKPYDKLVKHDLPIIHGEETLLNAYTQGAFSGDGFINTDREARYISLYEGKKHLVNRLAVISQRESSEVRDTYSVNVMYGKNFVPTNRYTIESRLDWLAGLIDTDGSASPTGDISISSVDEKFLLEIQLMLQTLGCHSTVSVMREAGNRFLPDGKGGQKEYFCETSYRLLISSFNAKSLVELGLSCSRVVISANPNRDASRFVYVVSITEQESIEEKVYCFNEPKNHSGIFNGIITAQCAEEPLPAGGSCLLGSINLSNFVTKNQLGNNIFDMDRFKKVVRKCVRALNDVLDEGLPMHPLQEQKDSVRDWRQIGLGVMGMGDLMIKLGIRYDTQEGVDMLDYIGSAMSRTAIDESCELAKEFGPFPKFNAENTIKSPYIQFNCDAELIEKIKTYGLRNSQLLTTAPTGSISTMIGASGGMEPVFSLYHQRTTKSLNNGVDTKFWIYHRAYLEKLVEEGQLKEGEVPKADNLLELKGDYPYIVTAHTMDPYMRIKLQATWQKYVDASISSTINLHNSATVEDVFNIYVEAWKQGLKGLTIYRDGCKRLAILEVKPKVEAEDLGVSRGEMLSRPEDCVYSLNKVYIGCGELNLMLGYSPSKRMIHDVFVIKSGQGGCEKNIQAQAIYLSGFLRLGGTLDMLESGITGVSACPSFTSARAKGRKLTAGSACPQAILNVIKKFKTTLETCENPYMLTGGFESTPAKVEDKTSLNAKPAVKIEGPKCGKCGTALEFTGGCSQCPNCGETKCD